MTRPRLTCLPDQPSPRSIRAHGLARKRDQNRVAELLPVVPVRILALRVCPGAGGEARDDCDRVPADAEGRELQSRCRESENRGGQGGNGQVSQRRYVMIFMAGGSLRAARRFVEVTVGQHREAPPSRLPGRIGRSATCNNEARRMLKTYVQHHHANCRARATRSDHPLQLRKVLALSGRSSKRKASRSPCLQGTRGQLSVVPGVSWGHRFRTHAACNAGG